MKPASKIAMKDKKLNQVLSDIDGWEKLHNHPLDSRIIESLELDDYMYTSYTDGSVLLSLYIGYYLSSKKVGAAHHPLVCYPGQGWQIYDKHRVRISLNKKTAGNIHYSTMIAQQNDKKDLIIYWFQSYDHTSPDTFRQKITLLMKRLLRDREDNAFVRISLPLEKKSLDEYNEIILKFIRSFYPAFLEFVKEDTRIISGKN